MAARRQSEIRPAADARRGGGSGRRLFRAPATTHERFLRIRVGGRLRGPRRREVQPRLGISNLKQGPDPPPTNPPPRSPAPLPPARPPAGPPARPPSALRPPFPASCATGRGRDADLQGMAPQAPGTFQGVVFMCSARAWASRPIISSGCSRALAIHHSRSPEEYDAAVRHRPAQCPPHAAGDHRLPAPPVSFWASAILSTN